MTIWLPYSNVFAFPVRLGYSLVEVVRSVQHLYSIGKGVFFLAFVISGKVERIRETTNPNTGEKTTYVELGDYGMMQEVACDAPQAAGVTRGAMVQVPVSVRANAFDGKARLNVRATDAFRVAQAQASR